MQLILVAEQQVQEQISAESYFKNHVAWLYITSQDWIINKSDFNAPTKISRYKKPSDFSVYVFH